MQAACRSLSHRPHRRSRARWPLVSVAIAVAILQAHWRLAGRAPQLLSVATKAEEAEQKSTKESTESAQVEDCSSLQGDTLQTARQTIEKWEKAAAAGQSVSGYGQKASRFLNQTLENYDGAVRKKLGQDPTKCASERKALQKSLENQLHAVFLAQSTSIEQVLYQQLKKKLLRRLRAKRGELSVKEKIKLLHDATAEYDEKVADLQPSFVTNSGHERAEKRLSELQWDIEKTVEAREMLNRWQQAKLRRSMGARKMEPSVSLSPGLRLMFRPDFLGGLGTLQAKGNREIGEAHNPAEISIGVLNDGQVADIYNSKPHPPVAKIQPVLNLELRFG
mmetsp:Transcript_31539/g.57971  ORF Transcript_31539/g.57971 Transcript_31539/m.57971 type:complete len:335 (+) Transcript_31539:117-1121(+)